jgi:hypothetical protein
LPSKGSLISSAPAARTVSQGGTARRSPSRGDWPILIEIPLTEEERAAVEDGQIAVDRLLERLAAVPTPSGPTPRVLKQLPVLQSFDQPEVPSE